MGHPLQPPVVGSNELHIVTRYFLSYWNGKPLFLHSNNESGNEITLLAVFKSYSLLFCSVL